MQDKCKKAGHPYNGARNNVGAQICGECIRQRKRRRYYVLKNAFAMDKMLREGLGMAPAEHERMEVWQAKVFRFYDALEEKATAEAKARRAKMRQARPKVRIYVKVGGGRDARENGAPARVEAGDQMQARSA